MNQKQLEKKIADMERDLEAYRKQLRFLRVRNKVVTVEDVVDSAPCKEGLKWYLRQFGREDTTVGKIITAIRKTANEDVVQEWCDWVLSGSELPQPHFTFASTGSGSVVDCSSGHIYGLARS